MTSTGKIYSQPVVPSVSATDGPVYFTVSLTVTHPTITAAASDGVVNGGGASVYYSQTLKMLFFSYYNGKECYSLVHTGFNPGFASSVNLD